MCDIYGSCRRFGCDCPLKGIEVGTVRMSRCCTLVTVFPKILKTLFSTAILENSFQNICIKTELDFDVQILVQKGPALTLCDVDLRW